MNWTVVQRILGLLLMMFSLTMLPPILFSLYYDDHSWLPFVEGFVITLLAGLVCWLPVHRSRKDLRLRDGFLVVAAFWTVLGTFGAAPLYFADGLALSFTDAVFESMSGLTTTGATVLTGLDDLPLSILYYRQQLQWLGGMGIIVLAVAVLPMLGVGGMQLYRAETPGPVKDTKLTPRITETAKALWYVYLAFTITCMIGYRLAGMGWFDALCHAFSTVAIGGFSTHDLSIGYFDSARDRSCRRLFHVCRRHQFLAAFFRLALCFHQALLPGPGVPRLWRYLADRCRPSLSRRCLSTGAMQTRARLLSTACSRPFRSARRPASRPRTFLFGRPHCRCC